MLNKCQAEWYGSSRLLRNYSVEYLARLTTDELEAERGGTLPESAQNARLLLSVVGIGPGSR